MSKELAVMVVILTGATFLLGGLLLSGCVDTPKEARTKRIEQEAGQDNAALQLRLDALEHRVKDGATSVEKRIDELERRVRALEQR